MQETGNRQQAMPETCRLPVSCLLSPVPCLLSGRLLGWVGHARGSAMEAAAALDTMRVMKVVTDSKYARGIELLEAVVAMLTKMT